MTLEASVSDEGWCAHTPVSSQRWCGNTHTHTVSWRDGVNTHTLSWTDGMDTHTHTHTQSQLERQRDGLCVQHKWAASPVCAQVSGDSSITDGGLVANYPKILSPNKKRQY